MCIRADYTVQGQGPAVVLLHRTLSSKAQWDRLVKSLSPDFRLIAIDLYGYGDAPPPPAIGPFGLGDEVNRVTSVLAEVFPGEEPFHLVGHSYGAAVALRLAHQAPEQTRSLCLFEPVAFHLLPENHPELQPILELSRDISRDIAAGRPADGARRFIDYWNDEGTFDALPPARQKAFSAPINKVALDFQALLQEPLTLADYRNLTHSACLLGGRRSPASTRLILGLLAETLQAPALRWVDGGHMSPITHAQQVNPIIAAHLRSSR